MANRKFADTVMKNGYLTPIPFEGEGQGKEGEGYVEVFHDENGKLVEVKHGPGEKPVHVNKD